MFTIGVYYQKNFETNTKVVLLQEPVTTLLNSEEDVVGCLEGFVASNG